MFKVLRVLAAIIAGAFTALTLVVAVEWICVVLHPLPAGFDHESHEQMCEYIQSYPDWVLAVGAALWGMTAFASTWVTHKIGGHPAAFIIELLLTSALVFNLSMVPYALWFYFASVLAVALGILPFAFDSLKKPASPKPIAENAASTHEGPI